MAGFKKTNRIDKRRKNAKIRRKKRKIKNFKT